MDELKRILGSTALLVVIGMQVACGQKGPLYLEASPQAKPSQSTASKQVPAAASAASKP